MSSSIQRAKLDGLIEFLTVAELRGFRAAARHLGMTPSAISQSIRALEARVGTSLFSRTTRTVRLTEAGEHLFRQARPAVEMLSDGLDQAARSAGDISGRLRISVPRPTLLLLTNRLLPEFLEAYPKVQLDLSGEDRSIDIVKEGFDAGIRPGWLVQPQMSAVPLSPPIRFAVIATPGYLSKYGRPSHPSQLTHFRCIQLRFGTSPLSDWTFVEGGKFFKVAVDGPLIVNDFDACLRAALRGVGLARLPTSMALPFLEKKQIEIVLDEYAVEGPGLTLYYPSRSEALPRLRAFAQFTRVRMKGDFRATDYLPVPLP